jgi:hypothetical protein
VLNDGTKALELRTRARQLQLQRQRLPNIRRCALIHILTYHILTYRRAHTEREGEGEGERASERASERERKREKEKVPITTHSPHHLPSHTCSHTHIDSRKINASTRACCLPPLYRPAIPASHELDTYACAHTHFLPPPHPPGLKGLPCNSVTAAKTGCYHTESTQSEHRANTERILQDVKPFLNHIQHGNVYLTCT